MNLRILMFQQDLVDRVAKAFWAARIVIKPTYPGAKRSFSRKKGRAKK